ncbi:MAG: hypothetical protein IIX49_08190 [Oscillospiraceae bacterium]|nr:hypothetical protein [Oscillospiraceae bacterium]
MFKYSGKEIKFWAKFLMVLFYIRSALELLFIMLMHIFPAFNQSVLEKIPAEVENFFGDVLLLISMLVCAGILLRYLIVRLWCTLLYAYGEIADTIKIIDSKMNQELQVLKSIDKHLVMGYSMRDEK